MLRKILCICMIFPLLLSLGIQSSAAGPFVDVAEDAYYRDSVLWAYTYGITSGKTSTQFQPGEYCTREQIVTFLWRMAGKPEPASMEIPFTDVPNDRFAKAILWASEQGIVAGYSDGTFRPDDLCTRKYAMTFLWRYFGCPEAGKTSFPDVKADRFANAIAWASENGITSGYPEGNFRPEKLCTRAEIVTFLYRSQHPQQPAMPTLWKIECDSYVNFWKQPSSGNSWGTIYTGRTVTVLDWDELYAYVEYNGNKGYIFAPCLRPLESPELDSWVSIVEPVEKYSYEAMCQDLKTLNTLRPWLTELSSIGTSEFGKDIPVLRIGREDAQYHVLLHGAIHAREYMTSWLLMAMAEYWITYGVPGQEDICFHIIPMVNPDGVTLSQTLSYSNEQLQIYYRDYSEEYTEYNYKTYFSRWKANGKGVDLNKNFPAGWQHIKSRSEPSSESYKGKTAFSAAETIALRDYTLRYDLDATVSYHASGSVLYYEYGAASEVNTRSTELARAVEAVTGYPLRGSADATGAGYKDWAIETLGIPSLTVEIGVEEAPLAQRELYSIFLRNLQVLPAIADWLS